MASFFCIESFFTNRLLPQTSSKSDHFPRGTCEYFTEKPILGQAPILAFPEGELRKEFGHIF
jgi:hypothetical protein